MAIRESINNYFKPSDQGVRKRDILREFLAQGGFRPGIEETAKAIPRDMARFGISALEAPQALKTGQASREWYNTPLGRINSFQSEAANRVDRGDPMWKAMGNPMMDTVLAGSDIAAISKMLSGAARPAMNSMRGVNLRGSVHNPFQQPGNTIDDIIERYIGTRSHPPMNQTMSPSARPQMNSPFPMIDDAVSGGGPFRLGNGNSAAEAYLQTKGYGQSPGGEWRKKAPMFNETESFRPGAPMSDPSLPSVSNSDIRNMQSIPTGMNTDLTDEESTTELIRRVLMGKQRIISPDDRPPINPRPYDPTIGDREQLMIDAGYRSDRSPNGARIQGLWKLKNKEAFAKFKDNPNVRPFVEGNPNEDSDKLVETMNRALSEGWDTGDVAASGNYMKRNGKIQPSGKFESVLPESYGDDITDEYSRSYHQNNGSYKKEFKNIGKAKNLLKEGKDQFGIKIDLKELPSHYKRLGLNVPEWLWKKIDAADNTQLK